jgi:hypothetical protein
MPRSAWVLAGHAHIMPKRGAYHHGHRNRRLPSVPAHRLYARCLQCPGLPSIWERSRAAVRATGSMWAKVGQRVVCKGLLLRGCSSVVRAGDS